MLMQQELERELNALKAEEASAKKQGDNAEKKRREMERGLAEVASKRAEAEAEVDRLKREKAAQVSCFPFHPARLLHRVLRISRESFRSIARPGLKKPSPNLRRKPVTVRVKRLKKRGK
jgi:chromosome segregation ATPase